MTGHALQPVGIEHRPPRDRDALGREARRHQGRQLDDRAGRHRTLKAGKDRRIEGIGQNGEIVIELHPDPGIQQRHALNELFDVRVRTELLGLSQLATDTRVQARELRPFPEQEVQLFVEVFEQLLLHRRSRVRSVSLLSATRRPKKTGS